MFETTAFPNVLYKSLHRSSLSHSGCVYKFDYKFRVTSNEMIELNWKFTAVIFTLRIVFPFPPFGSRRRLLRVGIFDVYRNLYT